MSSTLLKSIAEGFARGVIALLGKISGKGATAITGQLKRSSLSVPSNISEGLGRFDGGGSKKSRDNFFRIALGSLKESQTQLGLLKSQYPTQQSDISELELSAMTAEELLCVELDVSFKNKMQDREILARYHGSGGAIPVNCPQYPANDVSCASGSGDSLCGSFCGRRRGPTEETYWVTCAFVTPPTALSCICGWRHPLSPEERRSPPLGRKCAKCGNDLNGLQW